MEKVILSFKDRALIANEAARAHPYEACGLIYGERGETRFVVTLVDPLENAEQDNPQRRFAIAPGVLLQRHKEARRTGRTIIGHFHSHPAGPAEPSQTDRTHIADPAALWLIHGRDAEGRPVLNAFIPKPCGTDFKSLEVVLRAD